MNTQWSEQRTDALPIWHSFQYIGELILRPDFGQNVHKKWERDSGQQSVAKLYYVPAEVTPVSNLPTRKQEQTAMSVDYKRTKVTPPSTT